MANLNQEIKAIIRRLQVQDAELQAASDEGAVSKIIQVRGEIYETTKSIEKILERILWRRANRFAVSRVQESAKKFFRTTGSHSKKEG